MNITPTALRTPQNLTQRLAATSERAAEIESNLGQRAEDQVLLKVSADLSDEQIDELAADYGGVVQQELNIPDVMKEKFNGRLLVLETGPRLNEAQALAALEGDERVLLAATNDDLQLVNGFNAPRVNEDGEQQPPDQKPPKNPNEKLPNDLHPEQWALRNKNVSGGVDGADISAPKAWKITTGGGKEGPIVAVIDSGIDAYHEDLKANMWKNPNEERNREDDDWDGIVDDIHGLNAVEGNGNIFDEIGHGTHVAGIIGAVGDNGKGIAGVNWNSRLMGVKISDGERVSLVAAINGTLYATQHGARVANHSWGGPRRNPILEDVMKNSPMLHVCAAGNSQKDSDVHHFYPAGFDAPNIISVGATTRRDDELFFSNWGINTVDVHAPGARVYSTLPMQKYDELSGTSMAAPHVAGVAALIADKFPEASNQEIKDRVMYSSDPLEKLRNLNVSGGRLNAHSALEEDKVAPADIKNFKVVKSNSDGFSVSWNGVGDDGMNGSAARYELELDYGSHQQRMVPQFPSGAESVEQFSFETTPRDTDRPFTLKLNAVDNVGNRSPVVTQKGVMQAGEVPLKNNFDGETDDWTVNGKWAKVEVEGRGMVYTDSPDGPHDPGSDTSLISPAFSLKDLRNSTLTFDAKMVTNKYDFLMIETSTDGESWKNLSVIRRDTSAGYGEWGTYEYDLSQFDGAEKLHVRFNYEPSRNGKEDGVWIDDVKVVSAKED